MDYYCSSCKREITPEEYDYSNRHFHKALCRQHQPTKEAIKLYVALRRKGVPAKLENWDDYKHIDISIDEAGVDIEVDGVHHNLNSQQALTDLKRAYYSYKDSKVITLRIPNCLVNNRLDETVDQIIDMCNIRVEETEEEEESFLELFDDLF